MTFHEAMADLANRVRALCELIRAAKERRAR